MKGERRKELMAAYRERKPRPGVFVVRCAGGEAFVGATPDLEQYRNRLWFALRQGGHPNRAVQAAWKAGGEGAVVAEDLEAIDPEGLTPMGVSDALKRAEALWRETLGAGRLIP